jgi:hypothetical protein
MKAMIKMTQRKALELTAHVLTKLIESSRDFKAKEHLSNALEHVLLAQEHLKGDGFYDPILLITERTEVEVDLDQVE